MSSSTSALPETQSSGEQTVKEEASDQLKNGGEADQVKSPDSEVPRNGETGGGAADEKEDEEEEGECGFCLFMKGGGCRDEFIAWEKCVDEAEKTDEDVVEKCFQITSNLKTCMEAHADYYEPILLAEKAAQEEVAEELDREAEKPSEEQIAAPDSSSRSETSEKQLMSAIHGGGIKFNYRV